MTVAAELTYTNGGETTLSASLAAAALEATVAALNDALAALRAAGIIAAS